ncbi:MAG TPA: hypothetical protein VKT53_05665 [Candidatus Acidoferrum sp.]|nr:hypothetical protein [Candidatus Acidoferrum sp.]
MTGPHMKASLYLKNDLEVGELSVTPIIYLSNGVRYALEPVVLDASGTAVVDINQGLARQGVAPYAELYGYVEIEYQWPWDAVCATVRNVDTANSLIFIYNLEHASAVVRTDQAASSELENLPSYEGMWWKQEKNVAGFVALANVTDQAINASVRITDKQENDLAASRISIGPHATKMVKLPEIQSASGTTGGLYISHDGKSTALAISGGLADEAVGYSARLPILASSGSLHVAESQPPVESTVSELGLMTGVADPMMAFPAGTAFTPYSVVRNTSDQPATVTPTLWWMEASVPRSAELPQLKIAPHQTLNLEVPSLLAAAGLRNFNGSVNLILDTKGQQGALAMASGSVDQKNTYVFEVVPHGVSESAAKSISYWSTGSGDDTMVTLWNPADEDQDFVLTLFYTGGRYALPIRLAARATRMFNISEIIQSQIPDAEGNVIPISVHEGGAELAGAEGENQHILLAMDAGTYNVQKAICGVYCQTCDGVVANGFLMADNPFAVAVSGTKQQTFYGQWNTGFQDNYTSSSTWSSNKTSVATVSGGLVTGMGVGSVNVSAQYSGSDPIYVADFCSSGGTSCPVQYFPSGSAPGQVAVITVHFNGNLTPGDNLSFSNVAQTCSSTLGLKDCSTKFPSTWVWNVEIEADVSDDATNYTVSQGIAGLSKGFYRASNGSLQSFSASDNKPAPQDSPPSAVLQQVTGQKVIFWLDAPGRGTIYADPNNSANTGPIDSMTQVKNFTSSICSKTSSGTCWSVNWYTKIVVKSGGILDTTNSSAGLGSLSLSF